MICKYSEIFCWKNVSSFCSAKATHIFSAKNFRKLYIESAKTVNEMTLNELVKLTTLWTTGPWLWLGNKLQIVWVGNCPYPNKDTMLGWISPWSIIYWLGWILKGSEKNGLKQILLSLKLQHENVNWYLNFLSRELHNPLFTLATTLEYVHNFNA